MKFKKIVLAGVSAQHESAGYRKVFTRQLSFNQIKSLYDLPGGLKTECNTAAVPTQY